MEDRLRMAKEQMERARTGLAALKNFEPKSTEGAAIKAALLKEAESALKKAADYYYAILAKWETAEMRRLAGLPLLEEEPLVELLP